MRGVDTQPLKYIKNKDNDSMKMLKKIILIMLTVSMLAATACEASNMGKTDTYDGETTANTEKSADDGTDTQADESTPQSESDVELVEITFHGNGGLVNGKSEYVVKIAKNTRLTKEMFPKDIDGGEKMLVNWYNTDNLNEITAKNRITANTVFTENTDVYAIWNTSLERIPTYEIPNMTEKPRDKAYVTLVFDDNRTAIPYFYNVIVGEYELPMCAAVPAKTLPANVDTLKAIQDAGGEILSHGYNHTALDRTVPWSTVDEEFAKSKKALEDAGFVVNGIITVGAGGKEDTSLAYRQELEGITAKYYAYSDVYGAKSQFYKSRECFYNWGAGRPKTFEELKVIADKAIANNEWLVIYAHDTNECPLSTLRQFIEYMLDNGAEFVTYRDVYTELMEWDKDPNIK